MVEFGVAQWPYVKEDRRYIKAEVIPIRSAVGVNVTILYSLRRDGIGISLQTNVPVNVWNDSLEIQEAVREFLKIKDYSNIDVRADPSALLVRFDFKKHPDSLNYLLMHNR